VSNDFKGKYEEKKKSPLKPFYPVIGLFLILIAGAAAVLAAPFVNDFLVAELLGGNEPESMVYISGGAVFGLIITTFALIYSLFAARPENRDMLSEKALMKDKEEKEREERAKKRRKRQMLQKMRNQNDDI
jgi:type VI protein secretion system component VasK